MFKTSLIAVAVAGLFSLPVAAAGVNAGVGVNAGANLGASSSAPAAGSSVNGTVTGSGKADLGTTLRNERLDRSTSTNADMGDSMERRLSAPGIITKADGKAAFTRDLDANGDGFITRSEAKGDLNAQFNQLDKNRDGKLSAAEAAAHGSAGAAVR